MDHLVLLNNTDKKPHVNNIQKSAVLRAITEVYQCNMTQPRDAITFNEDYFKISLTLSNGYIVTRKVEKKERGFNGYIIYNPNTGNIEEYNTKALPMVQELLGMREIQLSDKGKDNVNINFLPQDAGWFYSNMSGPSRAKLLGTVYGTHYADSAIRNYNSMIKSKNADISKQKKELEKYNTDKQKYAKLPALDDTIQKAETKLKEIEVLNQKIQKAQSLIAEIALVQKNIARLKTIVSRLSINLDAQYSALLTNHAQIESAKKVMLEMQKIKKDGQLARMLQQKLTPIKNLDTTNLIKLFETKKAFREKYEKLVKIQKEQKDAVQRSEQIKVQIKGLSTLSVAEAQLKALEKRKDELEKLAEKTLRVLTLKKELLSIQQQGQDKNKVVKAMSKISELVELLDKLVRQKDVITKGIGVVTEIKQIQTKEKSISQTITTQKSTQNNLVSQYLAILKKSNQCPICHTSIDNDIIEKIIKDLQ